MNGMNMHAHCLLNSQVDGMNLHAVCMLHAVYAIIIISYISHTCHMDGGKCQYIVFVVVVAFGAICIKLSLSADLQLFDNKYVLNDIVFWGCQRTTLIVNYTGFIFSKQ